MQSHLISKINSNDCTLLQKELEWSPPWLAVIIAYAVTDSGKFTALRRNGVPPLEIQNWQNRTEKLLEQFYKEMAVVRNFKEVLHIENTGSIKKYYIVITSLTMAHSTEVIQIIY